MPVRSLHGPCLLANEPDSVVTAPPKYLAGKFKLHELNVWLSGALHSGLRRNYILLQTGMPPWPRFLQRLRQCRGPLLAERALPGGGRDRPFSDY